MWMDYVILVEQCEFVVVFQDLLDYEYYVGLFCIVFVEDQCDWMLQCLWYDFFLEFGYLYVVVYDDCVFVDEVELVDVIVEVYVYVWLVQLCCDLFDMG